MQGHTNSILSLGFSPDGERLVSASMDGSARVWDTGSWAELLVLSGHTGAVTSAAFSPDGTRIGTASQDGSAKLWDAATGEELLTFFDNGAGHYSLAFSPDGKRLAAANADGVRFYLLDTQELAALARSLVTRSLTVDECQKYLHRVESWLHPAGASRRADCTADRGAGPHLPGDGHRRPEQFLLQSVYI